MVRRTPRPFLAVALLALPILAGWVRAETPASRDRATLLKVAREVMEKARYCALVTNAEGGYPQARAIDAFAPEADLTVWIATNPATRKVAEIRRDPRVTLYYYETSGPGYVTLQGKAAIVTDPAEKAKRWKEDWKDFYADRNRGDDYVLIRVTPVRLEVVSYPHGVLNDKASWRPPSVELP
ncbi:MAG TPA: pyridoxamine 5'-phosphate oxidase family protein [Vicinamibacteria bacterium]